MTEVTSPGIRNRCALSRRFFGLLFLLSFTAAPALALDEAEILKRFEEYERRIEALEQQLEAVKREQAQPAAAPAATPAVSERKVNELDRRLQAMDDELRENRERIELNGFATVGVARGTSSQAFQSSGNQIHNDFDFNADTVLGLQVGFQVNEQADFVTQLVARGVDELRSNDEFDLQVDWAYLNYELDAATHLRLGRSRIPLFMHSEYLEVGFAYPWVRPPVEVYTLLQDFSNYDGINLRNIFRLPGDWYLSTQAYWGGRATDAALSGSSVNIDVDDLLGVNASLRNGGLHLFASVARADISVNPLPAALQTLEAGLQFFNGQTLTVKKEDASFAGTGFQYDDGALLLMGEYTRVRLDEWLNDWESYYVTSGYRFGPVLAHVTFANLKTTDHDNRIFTTGFGTFDLRDAPAYLDADQSSWTLGMRYDLSPGIALKAEWQRVSDFNRTAGLFAGPPGGPAQIWSFVLDTMF